MKSDKTQTFLVVFIENSIKKKKKRLDFVVFAFNSLSFSASLNIISKLPKLWAEIDEIVRKQLAYS